MPRLRFPFAAALLAAFLAPAALRAQPACPAPRTQVAAPLSGQPADVVVREVSSATVQPVVVEDTAGACLGFAQRVPNVSKTRWRAWHRTASGVEQLVAHTADSAWSQRADAVRAVIAAREVPPAKDTAATPPPPAAIPADSLVRWFGAPIRRVGDVAGLPPALAVAMQDYDTRGLARIDQLWVRSGWFWETTYYYDRALVYYWMWARTGNPVYRERGDAHLRNYRDVYLWNAGPPFGSQPHWSFPKGLYLHYKLTAWDAAHEPDSARRATLAYDAERSRTALVRNAEVIAQFLPEYYTPAGGDLRILGRMLLGSVLAWEVTKNGTDLPPETWPRDWAARIDMLLETGRAWQLASGGYRYRMNDSCQAAMNYQVGIWHDALIAAYTHYRAAPAIVDQVRRGVDWQWATQWSAAAGGFQYMDTACAGVGGTEVTADLTGLIVAPFAWLGRVTGDPRYFDAGDQVFAGTVRGMYLDPDKHFNQAFSIAPAYLGLR